MGDRAQRFAESVRAELGELIPQVKDPRVSAAGLLTVTHVRVSEDLGVARVQVAVHGASEEAERALLKGLGSAAGWLKREIGLRLRAKKVPQLRFHLDETSDKASRVEQLLREIASDDKARAVDETATAVDETAAGDETAGDQPDRDDP